jgi:MGT family glycosyltransferase
MKVLLIVFSDAGHLNPFLGVAGQLERRGHELTFLSEQKSVRSAIERAGLRARCLEAQAVEAEAPGLPPSSTKFTERLKKPAWAQRFLSTVLVDGAADRVEPIRQAIRATTPDVIGIDAMCYAGSIAAELERVPWAGLSTGFFSLVPPSWQLPVVDMFKRIGVERAKLFARFGVERSFRLSDVISPWLNLVFASETLAPRALTENYDSFYVGPSIRPDEGAEAFPWDDLPRDRPLVYVAFGSLLNYSLEMYRGIFESLTSDEAFFVVALKDLFDDPFVRTLPAHVLPIRFAPQLALLERATLMINHGGANSAVECLSRGRPMLTMPLVNDAHAVGRIVERAGAGRVLIPDEFSVARCRDILLSLLPEDSEAQVKARAIQQSFENGALGASVLLEELAQCARPMSPRLGGVL